MGFDTIKLEKGMYRESGKSFTQVLEQLDPSESYKGTALEGTDAFQRQLKRFDIRAKGAYSDPVEKFFRTMESSVLFPEYIARAVRQGMEENNVLPKITATTTTIDSMDYRSVYSVPSEEDKKLMQVAEGASIPATEVKTKSNLVQLHKRGRMLVASYEAIRFQKLDLFSVTLRQIGAYIQKMHVQDAVDVLVNGINKTIFATADDELRPVMNGIYINLAPGALTFVGTDAHKLVKYESEAENEVGASFILPKKPANLLKSVLLKEDDAIEVSFDSKNAMFKLKSHTLVCRLIEGNYPNYNAVIPANNPNKVLVDRIELVNGIKRVAVCSNPTTNLIRMDIGDNRINLTAQDIDFSVSANETITCSYDGEPISIGFKSTFLVEILSNMDTPTVVVELADSTRAGVFKPVYDDKQTSATLMLLMPMMINA